MTLRIEVGKRVYKFVATTTHKKLKLITIEALWQVLQSLWDGERHITDRDDRMLTNLIKALEKLRDTSNLKET